MENNEILKHFETLPDHRQNGKILHPMRNIVFIVLVGAFNRLDGWEEIADFAEYRREFFGKYLDLTNGIPSDDTLRRFFEALDSKVFRARFTEWASSIVPKTSISSTKALPCPAPLSTPERNSSAANAIMSLTLPM